MSVTVWSICQSDHGAGGRQVQRNLEGEEGVHGRQEDLLLPWTHQSSPQVHHLVR